MSDDTRPASARPEPRGTPHWVPDPYDRWFDGALCQKLSDAAEIFFPRGGCRDSSGHLTPEAIEAKRICRECPVLSTCQRQRLGEVHGIWGAMDERERAKARKTYAAAVRALPLEKKRRYGRRIATLRDNGVSYASISRQYALPVKFCRELERLWREQSEPEARQQPGTVVRLHKPWPKTPPTDGDAWIRHIGRIHSAWYVAEDPEAGMTLMRYGYRSHPSLVWIPHGDVRLTQEVTRVVRKRAKQRLYEIAG